MDEQTELLREIRDLVSLIAGPAVAERDRSARSKILAIVGKSDPRGRAVLLMDGSRNGAAIGREAGLDAGNVSRLCTALRKEGLLSEDDKPRLSIKLPADFFEAGKSNGQ